MSIFRSKKLAVSKGTYCPFGYILLMSLLFFLLYYLRKVVDCENNIQPTLIKYGEVRHIRMATGNYDEGSKGSRLMKDSM